MKIIRIICRLQLLIPLFLSVFMFGFIDIEYLESFHSDIIIHKDSSLKVTETIVYTNEGKTVHGVYRDFPTVYEYNILFRQLRKIDVVTVLRDGQKINYHVKPIKGGKRIYMGDFDVYIQPGRYTYTLIYKTDRQLSKHHQLFFPQTDSNQASVLFL